MKVNFEIEDNYAIAFEGKLIDLHNNFDFVSYEYIRESNQFIITWAKSDGDWVGENEYNNLQLIHESVNYININNKDFTVDLIRDKCLGEITFFPSIDRETNNAFIEQKTPIKGDDILYMFTNDDFIRIGCESIKLICK